MKQVLNEYRWKQVPKEAKLPRTKNCPPTKTRWRLTSGARPSKASTERLPMEAGCTNRPRHVGGLLAAHLAPAFQTRRWTCHPSTSHADSRGAVRGEEGGEKGVSEVKKRPSEARMLPQHIFSTVAGNRIKYGIRSLIWRIPLTHLQLILDHLERRHLLLTFDRLDRQNLLNTPKVRGRRIPSSRADRSGRHGGLAGGSARDRVF